MTIKTRLTLSLGMLAAVILTLIGVGFITLQHVRSYNQMLVSDHIAPMRDLKILADDYAVAIVDNVHKTRAGTVSWQAAKGVMANAEMDIQRTLAQITAHDMPADEVQYIDEIERTMAAAVPAMETLADILKREDTEGLVRFAEGELYPAIDPISAAVSAYAKHLEEAAFADIANEAGLQNSIIVGLIVAAAISIGMIGYSGYVIFFSVATRLRQMELSLTAIADGDTDSAIPYVTRNDEIGHIAKAAEVFRANADRITAMTQADLESRAANDAERRKMMADLRSAFGSVVAAASAGDLEPRVPTDFADAELNALAGDVNLLLDKVEQGLTASGLVLAALAKADLTRRVEGHFSGAFGQLQSNTNAVSAKLVDIIQDVRRTSGSLRMATGEILAGANDLAERTTRQAATIEETSAAIEQLAATVAENATRAEAAAQQAQGAATGAGDSGTAIRQANDAMARITAAASQISSIIGLIDDIAFQTNLLALNASVEAARAGDAGKGFAVVAQEVRRLAQSAAASSAEVKGLIEQSNREVQVGTSLVSTAATRIEAVLTAVEQNASAMHGIALASQEQARAIVEVSAAVRQLDEMTQHNAALVEQTNAAIEQTEGQAAGLDQMIAIFQLEDVVRKLPSQHPRTPQPTPRTHRFSARNDGLAVDWEAF